METFNCDFNTCFFHCEFECSNPEPSFNPIKDCRYQRMKEELEQVLKALKEIEG